MNVWIATISHRHGTDVYAAKTERKLYSRLVDYVMQWWEDEISGTDVPGLTSRRSHSNNQYVVGRYFELVDHESVYIGETELL
jgi:hypothetical protein